jgi:hypothetical protein
MSFVFTCLVATFATWSLIDIYFYSVFFVRVQQWAEFLQQSDNWGKRTLGYGLTCPYCLGHWVAALVLILLYLVPNSVVATPTILDMLLLLPMTARFAELMRENTLRPMTPDFTRRVNSEAVEVQHEKK